MKRVYILLIAVLLAAGPIFAGVTKKSKSNVTFRGFGQLSLIQSERLTASQKWTDSKSDFKGKGIAGGLAAKTILKSGDTGEIIDLPATSIYQLDNKKKEYTVSPIKNLMEEMAGKQGEKEKVEPGEKEEKSDIKITRSEFKVEDTGETSTINTFACRKYSITWVTEWENTQTAEKGSSRLLSFVWATPYTGTLQAAQEEEMKFARSYLEKIGIKAEKKDEDILGTNWLALLKGMGRDQAGATPESAKFAEEMKKIEGYPIVVDGKYYATGQKPTTEPSKEEQEEQPKSVTGVLGGLAKKALKKQPSDKEGGADEPVLAYYTEVTEIALADLGPADFQVPPDYKKKE